MRRREGRTYPCETVNANEDVRAPNDTFSRGASNRPSQVLIAVDRVDRVAVCGHDTGNSEVEGQAEDRAAEQEESTADTIDVREDDTGSDEEDNVLNSRGVEGRVTGLYLG